MQNLLSRPESNFKIKKNLKLNYNTHSLNLAHSDISGYNVCPTANQLSKQENNSNKSNCSSCCVGYNGNTTIFSNVMESRIKKTIAYYQNRQSFLDSLVFEVERAIKKNKKNNINSSFRLNTYSDIRWENHIIEENKTIFEMFPDTIFYDYTKLENRIVPDNYQLTYSHYGDWNKTNIALRTMNVAIAFEKLPKYIIIDNIKYIVIDGDETDLRIDEKINGKSVIVGLKFKGSKAELNNAILEGFALSKNNSSLVY